MKLKTSVHQVQTKQAVDVKQAEIQTLKAEIKELKSIVASVVTKPSETKEYHNTVPATTSHPCENRQDSELAALKKQVMRLQKKLDHGVTTSPDAYSRQPNHSLDSGGYHQNCQLPHQTHETF